jgi:hypothetical protein
MPPTYPLLLGSAEYAEQIMRAFGLKGDLPREIVPQYQLGFQMANMEGDEFAWLKRSILWETGGTQGAVVGQVPIAAFLTRVAAQSRSVMAVLDRVIVDNLNAAVLVLDFGLTVNGTSIADPTRSAFPRDDRNMGGGATSAYGLAFGTAAADPLGSGHSLIDIPANSSIELRGPWILTNLTTAAFRSAWVISGSIANQAMRVSAYWRERELHDSEQ